MSEPTLTREQLALWLGVIGIDPTNVKSVLINPRGISVTLYVVNEAGNKVVFGDTLATTVCHIGLVD